jgi:predicted alpha/beta superfamily hydrolase
MVRLLQIIYRDMKLAMRALISFIGLLLASLAGTDAEARIVKLENFASSYVQPRNISILLPKDYDVSKRRYPVVYMHDGQNLFEPGHAYGGQEWGIDEAMSAMNRQAIIVGVWNTNLRGREYLPAKVVANLPGDLRQRIENLHGGVSLADNYLRFLVEELKPFVDRSYRTRNDARSTSLMGSSMGGLISLYGMGEYPSVFGNAAALSIHWPLADPTKIQETEIDDIAAGFAKWLKSSRMRPGRNRFYTDHGSLNLDGFYRPYSERIDGEFAKAGWRKGSDWDSRIFMGTDHNEAAWRGRVLIPLTFLLKSRR